MGAFSWMKSAADKARARLNRQNSASGPSHSGSTPAASQTAGSPSSPPPVSATSKDRDDPLLKILQNNTSSESITEDVFVFQMQYQGNMTQANQVININQHVESLSRLYESTIGDFDAFKSKPDDFLEKARGFLDAYYKELLKLNADETKPFENRWGMEPVKLALAYYFDQRQYLYNIYSQTRSPAEPIDIVQQKGILMSNYKVYITEMLGRRHEYNHAFSFSLGSKIISFHPNATNSRSIKILAAFDQYYALCTLPGDMPCPRNPDMQDNINYAGENGRLGELKRQGLSFFKDHPQINAFTPLGVFGDIQAKEVKPLVYRV